MKVGILMEVGTIQSMKVLQVNETDYTLTMGTTNYQLPREESTEQLSVDQYVDVFIWKDKVTMQLPKLTVGTFEWVSVCKQEGDTLYVDIGTTDPVVISQTDLPALKSVWPTVGDRLYVTLKRNRQDDLFVVPAKERQFAHLISFADNIDLNENVEGIVIRTAREGTVILTEDGYRGFIHHSEREQEPRLGETVKARVIEVKEDGTLNVSLKPLKHERIDDDADKILRYLTENNGEMTYTDRSKPSDIKNTFQMSKSAFKRALGRLMKERKIEQRDGKTYIVHKK